MTGCMQTKFNLKLNIEYPVVSKQKKGHNVTHIMLVTLKTAGNSQALGFSVDNTVVAQL